MKLTAITRLGNEVPALQLNSGSLVDICAAQSLELLSCAPLSSVMQIIDIDSVAFEAVRALADRLEADDETLVDQLTSVGALLDADAVQFAPLLQPRLLLSCGMAYKEHLREMMGEANADKPLILPEEPIAFLKSPEALTAHRREIVLPAQAPQLNDFECEFSCVIGRSFHNVEPEEAMRHVAGYTLISDVGSRASVEDFTAGLKGELSPNKLVASYVKLCLDKQYPTFCPIGPVIHTADTFGDPHDVTVETLLNGEVMQSAHTSDLIFSIGFTLSYYSRWYRFHPGDIVTTGSPSGVGYSKQPPRFLRAGDVLETRGSRIGTLINPIVGPLEPGIGGITA